MIKKTLTALALLLLTITTAWADNPGPYPTIFIHGQQQDATNSSGWWAWDQAESVMRQLVDDKYNDYDYGVVTPSYGKGKCHVNSTVSSSNDNLTVYNFSYYNTDGSRGVISNDYSSGTLYPKSENYQSDYATSEANGEWAEHLAIFIDKVLAATGASKVNLVCHSMGGLVARNAINFHGCEDKVYKVLTVGTPNHGFKTNPLVEILATKYMYTDWQKKGEILEMGANCYLFQGGVKFKSTAYSGSKQWTNWLHDKDKPLVKGNSSLSYATVAGTRPRAFTILYPCWLPGIGWTTCPFQPNDGLVPVSSVYLGYADFNRFAWRWHTRYWDVDKAKNLLPCCKEVKKATREWIFDYHTPPEIHNVSWHQTNSAMSAMSMIMWGQPKYKANVYFTYKETDGWTFVKHKCRRKPSSRSWWYWHHTITNENAVWYTGKTNVKGGKRWCFKIEAVHKYQGGPKYSQYSNIYCSTSPSSQSPPDPGCPVLYTYSEIDDSTGEYLFIQDNTLLAHSEVFFDTLPDHLVLSNPPPALNGHYYLNISEDSTATSYFDEARLFAVDHPVETGITAFSNGDPCVYSDAIRPNACYYYEMEIVEDTAGNPWEYWYPYDLLDEILDVDTMCIVGNNLDSIFVSFPEPVDWPSTGIVMTTAPVSPSAAISPVKDYYYTAYMSTGDSGWSPIPGGQAFARHYPSSWAAELPSSSAFLSTEEDGITIKIVCNANTIGYFNSIALIKIEQDGWTMTEAPIDSALHWSYNHGTPYSTDIKDAIGYGDGMMAPYLEAGEQYALSFTALPDTLDTTLVRDFILKTHGVYGYGIFAPTDIEDHGLLPQKNQLRVRSISKDPTISIDYQLARAGRTTISVIDVTGRQIALLLHDDMEAGSYTLNWDGRYGTGQKIVAGVYFIRMVSGDFASNAKLVILD